MWRLDHQEKGLSQVIVTEDLWGVWTMLGIFICNLVCDYHAGTVTVKMLVASLCLTLWDPVDCSSPGPSVCGIFQARILEWFAISFSRGSSPPRDRTPTPISSLSCIDCVKCSASLRASSDLGVTQYLSKGGMLQMGPGCLSWLSPVGCSISKRSWWDTVWFSAAEFLLIKECVPVTYLWLKFHSLESKWSKRQKNASLDTPEREIWGADV